MERLTENAITNSTSAKILTKMLNEENVIEKLSEVGRYMVRVGTKDYTMTLRLGVATCPLDLLHEGVRTWSVRVVNSDERQVLYSSSLHPHISSHLGKLISKHERDNKVDHSESDWSELEKYAGL
tara:strand:- start:3276 stop:3650 length:375 start_codon:yes stop_codon:yes gene_type:complete